MRCCFLREVPARFVTIFFPLERKFIELPQSSWRQADVHRTSAFRSSNRPEPKKRHTPKGVCLFCYFRVHFRGRSIAQYRPDLSAFILLRVRRINRCSPPSSRRRQRSSALDLYLQICPFMISPNKKRLVETSRFLWRYRPDLNWRMRVLQTLALPLGHGTI